MQVSQPNKWKGVRPWKRHSLVLMVAGFVYIFVGISYIVATPTRNRETALELALQLLPKTGWGTVFIIVGVVSIISARWPPFSETWGYICLTALSSAWAAFYLMGVILGDSPPTNLSAVLTWGVIGFLWWAISGLINPDEEV